MVVPTRAHWVEKIRRHDSVSGSEYTMSLDYAKNMLADATQAYAKAAASTARVSEGEWQIGRADVIHSVFLFDLFPMYNNCIRCNAF